MAFTPGDRYNQGLADGGAQAAADWDSHTFTVESGGNNQCPSGHTDAYCQGYVSGYNNEWQRAIQVNYPNGIQSTSQDGFRTGQMQALEAQNTSTSNQQSTAFNGTGACRHYC